MWRRCGGRWRFQVKNLWAQLYMYRNAPFDYGDEHSIFHAARSLGEQIFVQQAKDAVHFGRRALPVGGRKREESKGMNAKFGSCFDDGPAGFGARAMPGGAWQSPMGSPAPVAVGNDGNVQ